jgi:hypothetical protein
VVRSGVHLEIAAVEATFDIRFAINHPLNTVIRARIPREYTWESVDL